MPQRKQGPTLSELIGRLLPSRADRREFTRTRPQRLAAGFAEAKEMARKERSHGA